MTQQAELLDKIDKLPPKYLGEVIDFIGYLQQKAQQEKLLQSNADDIAQRKTSVDFKWANPLLGLAKAKGATLTLDHFMEIQQEDIIRENKNDQRLWGKK
jgi:hypothetical protein